MKIQQIRTKESVHMGVDLTKSIIDGSVKGAKFPGLKLETYETVGIKITYNRLEAIVPWENIIVAISGEIAPQPVPIKVKVDTSAANS